MISINLDTQPSTVGIDNTWNFGNNRESRMHGVHVYPAKFPAFIATKALNYALEEGVRVQRVADIFCGCGTVALEAKLHNFNFWGCDINPVATLIAKAKSQNYDRETLCAYYTEIVNQIESIEIRDNLYENANERLKYWFNEKSFISLYRIKNSIELVVPDGAYKTAFLCIFSATLKPVSKWLTKSIKPQVDPKKSVANVMQVFAQQYTKFSQSVGETYYQPCPEIIITNDNFLNIDAPPMVDLIISSPPYVTSYEYADLHQLSSLWLGYVQDYRDLRRGTIGSVYNSNDFEMDILKLNSIGQSIVSELVKKSGVVAKVKSVARYYLDIQHAIQKCSKMVSKNGMVLFVVGDTEYKGVKIENSKHLIQCLKDYGFTDIKVAKRRISNKLLTPYRDSVGRFSTDKSNRTIYHEELIISGRM